MEISHDRELLYARVSSLPRKISIPLIGLLESEQLALPALGTILDAAQCSDQPYKLLGFAVAYHHLKMNDVPVDDVVRMAIQRGTRIHLDWKPKRWKTEHERLSRVTTLEKLAAENINYDLGQFEAHLPSRFPGYLIRSSRRLGMEGLRQRHCVASFHNLLAAGYCAIVVVFVDKVRWTVKLGRNYDPDRPVRITEVKSRYNAPASAAVRERIHSLLGIPASVRAHKSGGVAEDTDSLRDRMMLNLAAVLPVLRAHGVITVIVKFDGYGDSGNIDGASCTYANDSRAGREHDLPESVTVNITKVSRFRENGQYVAERLVETASLVDAFACIVEDYLEISEVDWYNDDGGFGEFVLEVADGTCRLLVERRINESEIAFDEEIDIDADLQD